MGSSQPLPALAEFPKYMLVSSEVESGFVPTETLSHGLDFLRCHHYLGKVPVRSVSEDRPMCSGLGQDLRVIVRPC